MDTWKKYKNKKHKQDLKSVKIADLICFGNFQIAKIAWLGSKNKIKQKHINNFFNTASLVLQATVAQKEYNTDKLIDIFTHIDVIVKDLLGTNTSLEDMSLMLGNLTELERANYTFVELIGFVRFLSTKI